VSRGTFSRLQYLAWQYIPECVCACVHVVEKIDVLLVTSLRDGMNLVSYEFVACQNEKKGVLVLSEVSSCAFTFSFPFLF
jgi:trehalose-6-phosphate synthase